METRASYALIGAAVLAAFAALIAFTIWLGKVEFDREFSEYDVVFEGAVNGLSEGGQVRYLGINVGEVVSLSLDRENTENVIARIRVDADTPVRTDSKAYLDFAGLTGVTFIQIR
ncbi:MAG TPA: MCE family protein, partial [Hyphomonadaceae bacterium]|nr:MCE family protein [Hyphomonadaceae bacterium]